jgi:hypothetical protein
VVNWEWSYNLEKDRGGERNSQELNKGEWAKLWGGRGMVRNRTKIWSGFDWNWPLIWGGESFDWDWIVRNLNRTKLWGGESFDWVNRLRLKRVSGEPIEWTKLWGGESFDWVWILRLKRVWRKGKDVRESLRWLRKIGFQMGRTTLLGNKIKGKWKWVLKLGFRVWFQYWRIWFQYWRIVALITGGRYVLLTDS